MSLVSNVFRGCRRVRTRQYLQESQPKDNSYAASFPPKPPFRTAGFSLLEVILVIAIIAVLAAALFPVFSTAREKTRQAVCASHLREIGTAVSLYRLDYDGDYPCAVEDSVRYNPENSGSSQHELWMQLPSLPEALFPYSGTPAIFQCPSDVRDFLVYRRDGSRFVAANRYEGYGISYTFNQTLGLSGLPETALGEPSLVYYASDVGFDYHSYPHANFFDLYGNVLFCDGHVRFQSPAPE